MHRTALSDSLIGRVEHARNTRLAASRAAHLHEILAEILRHAQRENAGFLAYLIAMPADEAARLAVERR